MVNVRNTDPITSVLAAHFDAGKRPTLLVLLLAAYKAAGAKGLTAEEAGGRANLLGTGYWKRVSDLVRDGYIETVYVGKTSFVAKTRTGSSGRPALVNRITSTGRLHLADVTKSLQKAA